MLASQHFNTTRSEEDDWFDTIVDADTRLFVDPFLIFHETEGRWTGAHDKIIAHFDRVFRLIAEGNLDATTLPYRKALALLEFKEPREFCLGFASNGSDGAGSGDGFAKTVGEAIVAAIRRGLEHPKHFEELGIFTKGIGRDRVSDTTLTILKADLVAYTQEIAARHGIACEPHKLHAAEVDQLRLRWSDKVVQLPTNPSTGRPLLFVPERFLRELPTLNATNWWDDYENQRLRDDVNYHVMGKVDKDTIIRIAREIPNEVRDWTIASEAHQGSPYDLAKDRGGLWKWDKASADFAKAHPMALAVPASADEFRKVIELVLAKFKLFVEEQGGWSLLWNDHPVKAKTEEAVQLLFRGIARSYCEANNISLDREVELGRGPVDFKFSSGARFRCLLEIKKEDNGQFWNGLTSQLPSYLRSDECTHGVFVAVRFRDSKAATERLRELPGRVATVGEKMNLELHYQTIDARRPLSASKVKGFRPASLSSGDSGDVGDSPETS